MQDQSAAITLIEPLLQGLGYGLKFIVTNSRNQHWWTSEKVLKDIHNHLKAFEILFFFFSDIAT